MCSRPSDQTAGITVSVFYSEVPKKKNTEEKKNRSLLTKLKSHSVMRKAKQSRHPAVDVKTQQFGSSNQVASL